MTKTLVLVKKKLLIIAEEDKEEEEEKKDIATTTSLTTTTIKKDDNKEEGEEENTRFHELNRKYILLEQKVADMAKMINENFSFMTDNKNEMMEKNNNNNRKKKLPLSVLDLLNSSSSSSSSFALMKNMNISSFNDFVSLEFNQKHLNILFEHKYEEGYVYILMNLFALYEKKK